MSSCTNCGAVMANDVAGSVRQVEAARLRDDEGLSYREIGIRLGGITRQRAARLVLGVSSCIRPKGGHRFRQPTGYQNFH